MAGEHGRLARERADERAIAEVDVDLGERVADVVRLPDGGAAGCRRLADGPGGGLVGVPVGVMDQTVVAMAEEGHAVFLDTRSLEIEQVFEFFSSLEVDGHTISPGYDYDAAKKDMVKRLGKQLGE